LCEASKSYEGSYAVSGLAESCQTYVVGFPA